MCKGFLEVRLDVPSSPLVREQLERTLKIELNSATMEQQIDDFLADLTDELRVTLLKTAQSEWLISRLMGEDVQ